MAGNVQTCYKFRQSDRIGDVISSGTYNDILGVYKGVWRREDLVGIGTPVIDLPYSHSNERLITFHRFGKPGENTNDDNFLALLTYQPNKLQDFIKDKHIESVEDCRYDEIKRLGRRVEEQPEHTINYNSYRYGDPYAGGRKTRKGRKGRKGRKARKTRTIRKN
jgi:hypothetical protein